MRSENESSDGFRLFVGARADYRWCIRAGLLDRSIEDCRDFVAGYVAMEEFYKARESEAHAARRRVEDRRCH